MTARILILAGDGIGPEVTASAVAVLHQVATHGGYRFTFSDGLIGGGAAAASTHTGCGTVSRRSAPWRSRRPGI